MSELRRLLQTHQKREIELSRRTLTEFMTERALQLRAELGFDWKPSPDAPDDYETLKVSFDRSCSTGEPLPISSFHNEDTLYLTPDDNVAFRFIHDVHHVRFALTFAVVDELELALWHLDELVAEGFEPSSLPWRMLHADLIGQAQLIAVSGQFPTHQRRFVSRCLLTSYERGFVAEARELQRTQAERTGCGQPRPT